MSDMSGSRSGWSNLAGFQNDRPPSSFASALSSPSDLAEVGSSFVETLDLNLADNETVLYPDAHYPGNPFLHTNVEHPDQFGYHIPYSSRPAQFSTPPPQPAQETDFTPHLYPPSASGCADESSVLSSEHCNDEETQPTAGKGDRDKIKPQTELPDLFYAHNPIKYESYRFDCSLAYSDFHGFIRNSLKKHKSRKNFEREQISDEKYELAIQIKRSAAGRSMSLEDKHREHWKLVRRALFGTSLQEPIPECPNKGKHDTCKARRTAMEKKKYRARSRVPLQHHNSDIVSDSGMGPISHVVGQPAAVVEGHVQLQVPSSHTYEHGQPISHCHGYGPAHLGPFNNGDMLRVPSPISSAGEGTELRPGIRLLFQKLASIEGGLSQRRIHPHHFFQTKQAVNEMEAVVKNLEYQVYDCQGCVGWQGQTQQTSMVFNDVSPRSEHVRSFGQQNPLHSTHHTSGGSFMTPAGSSDPDGHSYTPSYEHSCSQ